MDNSETTALPKLGGSTLWFVLGVLILCDTFSLLMQLFIVIGPAIAAGGSAVTLGLGAVVAVPLGYAISGIGYALQFLIMLTTLALTLGYYLANKVPIGEWRKIVAIGANAIIKVIPIMGALPTASLTFFLVVRMENAKRGARGLIGGIAGKALGKTPMGRVAGKVLAKAA